MIRRNATQNQLIYSKSTRHAQTETVRLISKYPRNRQS